MAAKMIRTSVPGIFLRGNKYVVTYRDAEGRQRKESFNTMKEARRMKSLRASQVDTGEYQPETHRLLHDYADEWLKSYDNIRENTRDDYELGIRTAKLFFSPRLKLTAITPKGIADYISHLKGQGLAPRTVAKRIVPLRSMFRTAIEQGLLRSNPCSGVRLPKYEPAPSDDDHEETTVKIFTPGQVEYLGNDLLFDFLACTGLRISEALALEWRHLTGVVGAPYAEPHVLVRRAVVRGSVGPPKSKYGRRAVPLPDRLAKRLRTLYFASEPVGSDLVFPNAKGDYLDQQNVRNRMLNPALKEIGCEWAGFHTFRHTFASRHLQKGTNLVALSRALGHHSPAFTLSVYAHLLKEDSAPALDWKSAETPKYQYFPIEIQGNLWTQ